MDKRSFAADQVLVTSPEPTLQPKGNKGVVLTNGWDREDFDEKPLKDESDTKAGAFWSAVRCRDTPALWRAFSGVRGQWTLRLGGQVADEVREGLVQSGAEVQLLGDMPHRESVQAMRQCDALLVIHNDSDSAKRSTPGKMFECLASGLPVLVVGPGDSDLAAICEAWGFAFVATATTFRPRPCNSWRTFRRRQHVLTWWRRTALTPNSPDSYECVER